MLLILSSAVIILILSFPYSPSVLSHLSTENLIPVVHTNYNSYFQLTALGYWASTSVGCGIFIVIGLMGLTAVLGYHQNPPVTSVAISAIFYGLLISIFGHDFIVITPIASLAWLYLIIRSANSPQLSFLVLLSTLIFILWLLLYSLSLPALLLAVLLHFIVDHKRLESSISIILVIGCVMLFALTLLSPDLPWPDYPSLARITSIIDGPPWLARPLVGEDLPFVATDRTAVISQYEYLLLPLAFLMLFTGLLVRRIPIARRAWLSCAVLFALVYLDFRIPEEFSQIAPLQSLPRLFPELSLIPIAPIALSIAIGGLILIIGLTLLRSNIGIFLGLIFTGVTLILNHKATPLLADTAPKEWTISPSRYVTNFFSPEVLLNAKSDWRAIRPRIQNLKLSSSNSQQTDARLILDKDQKTRWTPANAKQTGTEWLMFEFSKTQKIIGLELQTGVFDTDFPRGLRIMAGKDCNPDSLTPISSFKSWQGQAEFTPMGYPYFSAQSEVRLFFSKEVETNCLRIEQTGKSDNFDWSIAEFRLIKKTDRPSETGEESEE